MSTGGWVPGSPGPWGPQQQGTPYPGTPQQATPYPGTPQHGSPHPGAPPHGSPYPYGAPGPGPGHPWGPPTATGAPAPGRGRPRGGRGRRVALLAMTVLVVGGLVVLALLAFVVGPRFARVDVLDPAAVERGVGEVVTRDWRRTVTGVECPADVRARAGESFRCSATVDGRPRQVPVDVLDDAGTYQVGQPR